MNAPEKSEYNNAEFIIIDAKPETMQGEEKRFLKIQNLLNYPNIRIADTEATYNLTAWHEGMVNIKSAGAEDTIKSAN